MSNNNLMLIGRREYISFPLLGLYNIEAKIDTGAYTSSLHCKNIYLKYENSVSILYFTFDKEKATSFRFEDFEKKNIKNSFGEMEERYVIKTIIQIANKKIITKISLSNRDNMRYPVLIGRRLLKRKFIIDVNLTHVLKNII